MIATARAGDWFLVDYEGDRGWSSGAYLTPSAGCDAIGESSRVFLSLDTTPAPVDMGAQEETLAPDTEPTVTWPLALTDCRLTAGDIINLRAEPGVGNPIEAEIPFRSPLIATERSGDWFKVEYEGATGWVNIDFVFRYGDCG